MANKDWSSEEVRLTIDDYFEMLQKESTGQSYNKAEHNRNLQVKLSGRTKAAIELKHQNISAILHQLGYVFINGYKPRGNFQKSMAHAVKKQAERLGIHRQTNMAIYPLIVHSWTVFSDIVAVKTMDRSAFIHHGTAVPRELISFFGYAPGDSPKPITLMHGEVRFPAVLTPDTEGESGRVRLFWRDGVAKIIADRFPQHLKLIKESDQALNTPPEMRFEKFSKEQDSFKIEFIAIEEVNFDSLPSDAEPLLLDSRQEGARRQIISTVYERNLRNRLSAIHINGLRCLVCGFDFGETYGVWGAGYIEVHHLFPLAAQVQERVVDPATELIPVCANCHRMFHRKKDRVLSLEEVQLMVKSAKG
ncbi:HNH endonuclease [Desulfovibrio sp. TomC]|uniref:HNH endonuclease n=1 Tax=Desulfovibrio sp. TomC TaxID=1562888 RepID=UPI0005739D82|nr:HNH endonuclease [Desulfovibrio sp. TomC]KHK03927.1 hypothetical protein NY78_0369 [Desulfovibrio sp. TomC]